MPFLVSLEREMINVFEDHKRTVVKLKSFFFKTLYLWTTALDFYMPSFHNFLNLFSFSNLVFFLYTSCVLGLCLFVLLMIFRLIQKKKKKKKKKLIPIITIFYHIMTHWSFYFLKEESSKG
jgi:uncharacterized membrane protein (DUF373 family)